MFQKVNYPENLYWKVMEQISMHKNEKKNCNLKGLNCNSSGPLPWSAEVYIKGQENPHVT